VYRVVFPRTFTPLEFGDLFNCTAPTTSTAARTRRAVPGPDCGSYKILPFISSPSQTSFQSSAFIIRRGSLVSIMSIRLLLSSNSVYNTAISCDSLGIHYQLSKANGIVSLTRWDPASNSNVLAGQYQFNHLSKSRIKMGDNDDGTWMNMKDLLFREGSVLSPARYFIGNSGMKYKWSHGWGSFEVCPWSCSCGHGY
jgi:hypothetical protein